MRMQQSIAAIASLAKAGRSALLSFAALSVVLPMRRGAGFGFAGAGEARGAWQRTADTPRDTERIMGQEQT